MAAKKYLTISGGKPQLESAKDTASTGAADAGKIPALNANGQLEPSLIPVEDAQLVLAMQIFN